MIAPVYRTEIEGDQFSATEYPAAGLTVRKCTPGAGSNNKVEGFVVCPGPFHGELQGKGYLALRGAGSDLGENVEQGGGGNGRTLFKKTDFLRILGQAQLVEFSADGNEVNPGQGIGYGPEQRDGGMLGLNADFFDLLPLQKSGDPLHLPPILPDLQTDYFERSLGGVTGIGEKPAAFTCYNQDPVASGKTGEVPDIGQAEEDHGVHAEPVQVSPGGRNSVISSTHRTPMTILF